MSDFRDSYSPPLLEPVPPRSLSPPPVKLKRKKPDVLPLPPQRPDTASVSPVLTPMGPGTDELDTIWEPASQLSLFLAAQHDMTSLSPQHLEILERSLDQKEKLQEQPSEKDDRNCFLQQDLSSCTRELDVLFAQLNQLTPTLSESQLGELDGLRTCPESDLLPMEPRAHRGSIEFLRQSRELVTQRDIVSERDNEVRDLRSERSNTRVLLEHLERMVSRHEKSLRSTVVKRQTAQNGVSSEVEVLKTLKCLFDHHQTLDHVKDKLGHQVARTKELEHQLKSAKSLLEQSTQQLDDSRELYDLERERREESNKKLKDLYSLLTNKERAIDKLEKQLPKCQRDLSSPIEENNTACTNYSPDVTPFSSRKSSPIEETKQSPTESEGMGSALRGSHSSLSDIDTVTTVLDNSHIVDESLFERTEMDPGAPKLSLSHSRKKSFKRKSSIRRIVSSFRSNRASIPKEVPLPLATYEPPEGRLARLAAAISSVERQNTQFLLWSPEALQGWVEVELGLPESVGEAVRWQCWTVSMLLSMGERDYEHELGIVQPLLRLKLMKAVQERVALSKASTPCLYSPYRGVNHQWIASHWLPSLGLSQYSNNFRQCCVDGRVLEHLTKKELRTSLGMVESSHRNSLQFGIIALRYLNYDTITLEEKQRQTTAERTEMPFWSNGQVAQWLTAIGLGNYTANIESSGLHGAVLYFDTSYDYHEIAITLQIPQIDSVARKTLKSSLYDLICQPRSSNLDKKGRRKSFALFHRKSPEPSQSPDLLTPGSPSPLRAHEMPPVCSEDEDRANPVQFLC